ncbi:MAG: SAVED domain-containing protein [Candidatus Sedimenticola sp. (ex Thyasira tokunagai)]
MSNTSPGFPLNQAVQPPLEDLALIDAHIRLLEAVTDWSDVGILIDEGNKATLILLLNGQDISAVLRFCLSADDSARAIDLLRRASGKVYFGAWQGHILEHEEIHSLDDIQRIWLNIPDQIVVFSTDDVRDFFTRIEDESIQKGRNAPFSTPTKRAVMLASHGRCMFEGCGENLGFDPHTGTEGNFAYLAHNVASSENGPRGVVGLSEKLSDDPSNVLLLCDKHHRLVDKVAAADYPAERLSRMRREFCETADRLLTGLKYQPIPAFAVLWPFNQQTIAPPSPVQIAQSLSKINARLDGQINVVSDNDEILRASDPGIRSRLMPTIISSAAETIRMQAGGFKHRAALFAFGLMPSLIALGAKLGNKNEIVPMLRYRDGGQWTWPSDEPTGKCYEIIGLEELTDSEHEVVLILAFTADPEPANAVARNLSDEQGIKTVKVKAKPEFQGNGAIAHPADGMEFMKDMQALLHTLTDKHQVNQFHVLPCASNATCVFFGQAYDKHHPNLLVYDFNNGMMRPELLISNNGEGCSISAV